MGVVTYKDSPTTTPPPLPMTSSMNATENMGSDTKTGVSAGLVGTGIFIIIVVVIIVMRRRRCNHDDNVSEHSIASAETNRMMNSPVNSARQSASYWDQIDPGVREDVNRMMLDFSKLALGKIIGKGQFGCVYEATYDNGNMSSRRVAVKTLKGDIQAERVEAFLQEGMIMREFNHENVLTLIGVAFGEGSLPMIVLPFMALGNLKAYVSRVELAITVRQLLELALQVARGMSYLATKKFVHRDLAARNCMLNDEMVVKVADFGLSRDIYTKDYYSSKDGQALLPVKWMAIESLTNSLYTTKTDVWSYGVLMWELMTRGATPYPDVSNWDIRSYIEEGRRMQKPLSCPDEVYELMNQCWLANPVQRPLFRDIVHRLATFLRSDEQEDDDKDDDDMPDSPHFYINLGTTVNAYTRTPSDVL